MPLMSNFEDAGGVWERKDVAAPAAYAQLEIGTAPQGSGMRAEGGRIAARSPMAGRAAFT
jgi:hypothetical protein